MKNFNSKFRSYVPIVATLLAVLYILSINDAECIPDSGDLYTEHETLKWTENSQGVIVYERKIIWCEDIPVQPCEEGCWERWPQNSSNWLLCEASDSNLE